jgi:RNA polymerase sigma-70 factor (ECF subfamily)
VVCFGGYDGLSMDAVASSTGDVTVLLQKVRAGDSDAVNQLIPLVLNELRTLARLQLQHERPGHTLQPTALVHEVYLRLVSDEGREWKNRAHFIGVSVSVMRRILIDYARRKRAMKRDGGEQVAIDTIDCADLSYDQADELLALDRALDQLELMNSRQRRIVELRYFGGLSVDETAEVLKVSTMTVKRDWATARAWLKGQVRPEALR